MKYTNKILYKNEICEYIIQILGNSSTKAKLIVTGTDYMIAIAQWRVIISQYGNCISVLNVQVRDLIFGFTSLSFMVELIPIIPKIKETIRDLLCSEYSNKRVFDLICNFNPKLSILRDCISPDNQSYFRWVSRVSRRVSDGGLVLQISIYSEYSYVGDICMTLSHDKIAESVFNEPHSVISHICKNPNDSSELTGFIKKLDSKLSDEKDKQL